MLADNASTGVACTAAYTYYWWNTAGGTAGSTTVREFRHCRYCSGAIATATVTIYLNDYAPPVT